MISDGGTDVDVGNRSNDNNRSSRGIKMIEFD